jgi:hypothetical protein
MESWSTSVELHILTTHLHTAESGMWEVISTGQWVELPSWKKAEGSVAKMLEL